MEKNKKQHLIPGVCMLAGFALWTLLIHCVDVRRVGPNGSAVGFASCNVWFHGLTGVHMTIYTITDWLGLVPIFVCLCFGLVGISQWIRRRSVTRVDIDIIFLGIYYIVVILGYLIFEMVPINYRPILIDGVLEASYPSSTTLLVSAVMPTLKFQVDRRVKSAFIRKLSSGFAIAFTLFMVLGRLISGVHWLTDIAGAVLLSIGLFLLYAYVVDLFNAEEDNCGIS